MTFKEKIDKILKINRLEIDSVYGLEKFIGASVGSIRKFYEKDTEPGLRTVKKIWDRLGVNDEWWRTGNGDIFEEKSTSVPEENKLNEIPFYDTVAVGGTSILAEQNSVYGNHAEMINPGTFLRGATGSLRIYGHSMFPKYPAGCIVAFRDADKEVIIWGEDYVIELEDRRIIKRVEKSDQVNFLKAVSYNKSEEYVYSPVEIPLRKIKRMYMVLGKVELEASI